MGVAKRRSRAQEKKEEEWRPPTEEAQVCEADMGTEKGDSGSRTSGTCSSYGEEHVGEDDMQVQAIMAK